MPEAIYIKMMWDAPQRGTYVPMYSHPEQMFEKSISNPL